MEKFIDKCKRCNEELIYNNDRKRWEAEFSLDLCSYKKDTEIKNSIGHYPTNPAQVRLEPIAPQRM